MMPATRAMKTTPRFQVGAITDEFSPTLDVALEAMAQVGLTSVELRVVDTRLAGRPSGVAPRAVAGAFLRHEPPHVRIAVARPLDHRDGQSSHNRITSAIDRCRQFPDRCLEVFEITSKP
jgi:hypothetical protein